MKIWFCPAGLFFTDTLKFRKEIKGEKMGNDIYVKGKTKNDLLTDLKGTVLINTASFEQIRMA